MSENEDRKLCTMFKFPSQIKPYQFKQLLQELEALPSSTLKTFLMSEVPSLHLCGESRSPLRKAYYQVIAHPKRRLPSKYLHILDQEGVYPSTKPLSVQGATETMVDNADNDSIAFTLGGDNNSDYTDYEEEEEELGKDVKLAT
eukprot:5679094-Ditylum_brightwellii.AAC.1